VSRGKIPSFLPSARDADNGSGLPSDSFIYGYSLDKGMCVQSRYDFEAPAVHFASQLTEFARLPLEYNVDRCDAARVFHKRKVSTSILFSVAKSPSCYQGFSSTCLSVPQHLHALRWNQRDFEICCCRINIRNNWVVSKRQDQWTQSRL